jgi:polysaccharide deacetylase family protein (PEP-CTERM system associated)
MSQQNNNSTQNTKPNIMTIDVEDWYNSSIDLFRQDGAVHGQKPDPSVVDNTLFTLDLLSKTKNTATFFILGTVAEYYPELVKEIRLKGHEVATHGYAHQLVYNLTPEIFEQDLRKALDFLDRAGCPEVLGYRAPYWSITKKSLWALDVLEKMGMKYDSSIFPIHRGLYGIPDAPRFVHRKGALWEFPPSTIRCMGVNLPIAGGGYLRLAPYGLVKKAIQKSESKQMRVFYFHPYELDPGDVKVKHEMRSTRSLIYYLQQKTGRGNNPQKLIRLLSEYAFVSIESVLPLLEQQGGSGSESKGKE